MVNTLGYNLTIDVPAAVAAGSVNQRERMTKMLFDYLKRGAEAVEEHDCEVHELERVNICLLYTSPSPRDA